MSHPLASFSQLGSWLRFDLTAADAVPADELPVEASDKASSSDTSMDTVSDHARPQPTAPVAAKMDVDNVDISTWAQAVSSAAPPDPPRRESAILQIPADVLLLITDYLDDPSALALSLTCRCAYALCYSPTLTSLAPNDKRAALQLLERDPLMPGTYYCHTCNILHPFRRDWGPHSAAEAQEKPRDAFHCGRRDRFAPNWNNYDLRYAHARLVMNAHLYGPDHGIPLQNICLDQTLDREGTPIRAQTAARILADELFVRRTYSFRVPAASAAVDAFRRCTGARDFRVCEHTSFFSNSSVYRQYIPEIQRRPAGAASGFVPCEDAPGSCGLCLMDFDVSIEAPGSSVLEGDRTWGVTIRAYHRLGSCRAPDDWRWARFSESSRPHLFFPNRPNRRGSTEYPGEVRKRWVEAEEAERAEEQLAVQQLEEEQKQQVTELEKPTVAAAAEEEVGFSPMRIPAWLWTQANAPLAF